MGPKESKCVVFDIGNVFVRWNPRTFYRGVFNDDDKMEWFLTHVCSPEWNLRLDCGVTYAEATSSLKARFPDWSAFIEMYEAGWEKMFSGVINGTVEILGELKRRGTPVYAITNWSHEKIEKGMELFPFFRLFDGIVVSGREKLVKPDPQLYELFLKRYGLAAPQCHFTDDLPVNVEAAKKLGFHAHVFTSPEGLATFLRSHGLL